MSSEKVFKTVLVGGPNTGKTALRSRFLHNSYTWQYQETQNADFVSTYVLLDGSMVAMQIWDTGGSPAAQPTANSLCDDADGVFLLFTTDSSSIAMLQRHLVKLRQVIEKRAKSGTALPALVLVLAKADAQDSIDAAAEVCKSVRVECMDVLGREVAFVETSARTGRDVAQAFRTMAALCQTEWSRVEAVQEKPTFAVLRRNKVRVSRHGDPITPYHRLDVDEGSELSVKSRRVAPLAVLRLRLKSLGRRLLCCM
ncbi:ras GTPase [Coemansia sp. RSA 2607]|nr:ras GTPase [Coemansia sp. RSA 2607]